MFPNLFFSTQNDLEIDVYKTIDFIRYLSPYDYMYMGAMHQSFEIFDEGVINTIIRFEFEQFLNRHNNVILR